MKYDVKAFELLSNEEIADGIFDITAVIYYISVTLIFLCFTVQSESKRR